MEMKGNDVGETNSSTMSTVSFHPELARMITYPTFAFAFRFGRRLDHSRVHRVPNG